MEASTRNLREQLSALNFSDVCEALSPGNVADGVWKVAEALVRVMHSHYAMCQWLRRPFDRRNRDPAFLHRCDPDAEDPVEDALEGESGEGSSDSDPGGRESYRVTKAQAIGLQELREDVLACRKVHTSSHRALC